MSLRHPHPTPNPDGGYPIRCARSLTPRRRFCSPERKCDGRRRFGSLLQLSLAAGFFISTGDISATRLPFSVKSPRVPRQIFSLVSCAGSRNAVYWICALHRRPIGWRPLVAWSTRAFSVAPFKACSKATLPRPAVDAGFFYCRCRSGVEPPKWPRAAAERGPLSRTVWSSVPLKPANADSTQPLIRIVGPLVL